MYRKIRTAAALLLALTTVTAACFTAFAATQVGPGGVTYDDQAGPGGIISDPQKDGFGPGNPNGIKYSSSDLAGTVSAGQSSAQLSGQGSSVDNPHIIDSNSTQSAQGTTAQNQSPQSPEAQNTVSTDTTKGQVNISSGIAQPVISSEAACLYDATTGQVLFDKNCNKAMFPASTTKLLTALIAAERLGMDDTVSFTASSTQNLESGASNVGMVNGDTMKVKDALHALLLKSACEVANAIGEKVSGSQKNFAEYLNSRAQEIGCRNTHFTNASGLNDTDHYSTAYDLCVITKAAIDNAAVRSVLQTSSYTLPASKNRASMTISNGNKMIGKNNPEYYAGIIGGKTGFTSKAGNTLATAANVGGHELIAVVLKSNSKHYADTKALYNYGAKLIAASGSGNTDSNVNVSASASANGKWKQTDGKWQYIKSDGNPAKNEWLDLGGVTYFIGSDGYMATGWKQFTNGSWYYFNPENGAMVKSKWVNQNGKSYYLKADGVMATNTVIDGKYRVDANGVYQP